MARIIDTDTSAFAPAIRQGYSAHSPKTASLGDALGMANSVIASPLTGLLIRGGQEVKSAIQNAAKRRLQDREKGYTATDEALNLDGTALSGADKAQSGMGAIVQGGTVRPTEAGDVAALTETRDRMTDHMDRDAHAGQDDHVAELLRRAAATRLAASAAPAVADPHAPAPGRPYNAELEQIARDSAPTAPDASVAPTEDEARGSAAMTAAMATTARTPAPVAKPVTISGATDEQLATVRKRLSGLPDSAEKQARLVAIDRELQHRDDVKGLAEAPLDREEIWARAKNAHTPEEQAAVMADLKRVRIPRSSLHDVISGAPEDALAKQVQGLFPVAPREDPALTAAKIGANIAIAEQRRANAGLAPAKGDELGARADLQRAKTAEVHPSAEADRELKGSQAGLNDMRSTEIATLLHSKKAKLDADAARAKAMAAKLSRVGSGKGGGAGLSKEDLLWAKEQNDRGRERVQEAAGLASTAERAAQAAADHADAATARAELAAAQVGARPVAPPNASDDVRRAVLAEQGRYDHQKAIADGAVAAAKQAQARAEAAQKLLQEAQALHATALKAGDGDRALADQIRQHGIRAVRAGKTSATAPAAAVTAVAVSPATGKVKLSDGSVVSVNEARQRGLTIPGQ